MFQRNIWSVEYELQKNDLRSRGTPGVIVIPEASEVKVVFEVSKCF